MLRSSQETGQKGLEPMISRDKIQKVDILTPSDTKIISATSKYFSIPSLQDSETGKLENVLMIRGKNMPEIERNSPVNVIVYRRTGQRIKYEGKVKLSTDFQLNVALVTAQAQLLEERRRYYKVEANLVCVINSILREERDEQKYINEKPLAARIQDFNIGGIFLCISEMPLYPGDIMNLTIMMNNQRVDVSAQVLRIQLNSAGDICGYGCRFLNVSPKTEEVFAKFVYQAQREALQKNEKQN